MFFTVQNTSYHREMGLVFISCSRTTARILLSIVKRVCWSQKKTGQANSVSTASGAALVVAVAGHQMAAYGIYSYGRLKSDIGKKGRKDVKKVLVEELVAMCQCEQK
uniref:Uncharacterized protein n=1 Tax=Noccaea caerulescens TaxID=107243 RepID=A0A1J3HMH2_NOCCA